MTDNSEQPVTGVPTPVPASTTSTSDSPSVEAITPEKLNQQGKSYYNNNKNYGRQNNNNFNAPSGTTGNRQYQKKTYNPNQPQQGQQGGKYQQNYNNYGYQQQQQLQQYPVPNQYGYPVPNQYGYPVNPYAIPQYAMQPPQKVTLSTKDGKVVDLEEKKRAAAVAYGSHSSISSPISAASVIAQGPPSQASPSQTTPTQAPATPVQAAPVLSDEVKQAIANKPVSAAEEFKRRIREKAEAALKAKAAKAAGTAEPAKVEAVPVKIEATPAKIEAPAVKAPVEAPVETVKAPVKVEAPVETKTSVEVPVEAVKPVEVSKVVPIIEKAKVEEPAKVVPKVEEPIKEEPKVEETTKEAPTATKVEEPTVAAEPIAEAIPESTSEATPLETEDSVDETVDETVDEIVDETADETPEEITSEEPSAEAHDSEPKEAEDETSEVADEEEEEEEDETKFSISKFLDRLSDVATPIDDIYSTAYPEGTTGPSSERKLEGKKYRYDPQFLVQFQDLVTYPFDSAFKAKVGIIDINIQPKRTGPSQGNGPHSGSGGPRNKFGGPMTPRFGGPQRGSQFNETRQNSRSGSKRKGAAGGSSRDKSTRKGGSSKRGGRDYNNDRDGDEYDPSEITIPVEEIKPLVKSATRWTPKKKTDEVKYAPDGSILLSADDVHRKVKSLLNKLTLEMFTEITDELVAIANQTRFEDDLTTIQTILSLTFAKATDEPHWCKMYASFCAKLISTISDDIKDKTVEDTPEKRASFGGALARRILLTTCQTEYEKGWVDKLPTNEDGTPLEPEMMSDEYYAMASAKRRGLGLVEFIGHLYNAHLLNDSVIYVCIKDSCKQEVSEENLENFTKLLKTVGPNMDTDERKRAVLKLAFNRIDEVLNGDYGISSRSKFMLLDLKELRSRDWKSNKADDGPKTLTEIHRDAEIQKMEEQRASNERRQKRNGDSGSRSNSSRGPSGWNNNNNNSGGHSNQGGNQVRRNQSFGNRDLAGSRDQRSGSGASSGSPGVQRDSSRRTESATNNRFAYLSHDNDGA